MVEASEMLEAENVVDYTKTLREHLSGDIRVEYLHGKMKAKERTGSWAFAANEIQVLVSTTVIEVGINVPNATVMMIENSSVSDWPSFTSSAAVWAVERPNPIVLW